MAREGVFIPTGPADDGQIEGRLVAFVHATDKRRALDVLIDEVRDDLPSLFDAIDEMTRVKTIPDPRVPSGAQSAAPDPSGFDQFDAYDHPTGGQTGQPSIDDIYKGSTQKV